MNISDDSHQRRPDSDPQSRFVERYRSMSSDELLRVMLDRHSLVPEAASALERECARRGLDEASTKAYQEEIARNVAEAKRLRAAEQLKNRRAVWPQSGVFVGGAILTALFGSYILGLSDNATYLLTKMLVNVALAAVALGWAFGGHWLTIKRACLIALFLYGGVLIWIIVPTSGHLNGPH